MYIALLLPIHQFQITKMMMLIFSVLCMCLLPYSAEYSFCRFLNSIYFKEQIWLLQNIAYAQYSIILRNLNYVQCLNIAPMEKAWFMAPMEYRIDGKGIMNPMDYTPCFLKC